MNVKLELTLDELYMITMSLCHAELDTYKEICRMHSMNKDLDLSTYQEKRENLMQLSDRLMHMYEGLKNNDTGFDKG